MNTKYITDLERAIEALIMQCEHLKAENKRIHRELQIHQERQQQTYEQKELIKSKLTMVVSQLKNLGIVL